MCKNRITGCSSQVASQNNPPKLGQLTWDALGGIQLICIGAFGGCTNFRKCHWHHWSLSPRKTSNCGTHKVGGKGVKWVCSVYLPLSLSSPVGVRHAPPDTLLEHTKHWCHLYRKAPFLCPQSIWAGYYYYNIIVLFHSLGNHTNWNTYIKHAKYIC